MERPSSGAEHAILKELGIVPCDELSERHEAIIRIAGYDVDAIFAEEGLAAERLHDAFFVSEEIAQTILGTNYERILGSIETCVMATEKLPPGRIVDLGGACGVVCFEAARKRPDCEFVIVDRSQNALSIGRTWARRLGLNNVMFQRLNFDEPTLAREVLGETNVLVLLEYIFDLGSDWGEEDGVIAETQGALRTAAQILRPRGLAQVRFGEFSEGGLTGMIRAAFRGGFLVESVGVAHCGYTLLFRKDVDSSRSENSEVFGTMDDISRQHWVLDGPDSGRPT